MGIDITSFIPSTVKGERKAGVSGVGIQSYKLFDLVYHVNAGVELDRSGMGPNAIWGLILEYPFEGKFCCTAKNEGVLETSGLVGFIWRIKGVDFDFGARKGFSDVAADWELIPGMTLCFN